METDRLYLNLRKRHKSENYRDTDMSAIMYILVETMYEELQKGEEITIDGLMKISLKDGEIKYEIDPKLKKAIEEINE